MAIYSGKTAIITGGASGIGLSIAKHLLENGAKGVVIAGRGEKRGESATKELGDRSLFVQCDVASWVDQVNLFQKATERFGKRIDYVFGNAGIAEGTGKSDSSAQLFHNSSPLLDTLSQNPPDLHIMEINLTGILYTTYLALAYFRQQDKNADGCRGRIVLTSSNAAFYPFPAGALYATSKSAFIGLIRSVGPQVLHEGIYINALGPSVVASDILPPDFFDTMQKEGRLTPTSTITTCIDTLLDPKSRQTGQMIENVGNQNVVRPVPDYLTGVVEKNLDEFFPVETTAEALDTKNFPSTIPDGYQHKN